MSSGNRDDDRLDLLRDGCETRAGLKKRRCLWDEVIDELNKEF